MIIGLLMKYIFYKFPASMLMGFGSHFGSLFSKDWDSDSSAYIHSRIYGRFFINLSISSTVVSKAIKFVHFFNSRKLRFLYFLHEGFGNFLRDSNKFGIFKTRNFFLVKDWIPGLLTNYKTIALKINKLSKNISNLREYPNGLIFLNSERVLTLSSREARISKSPSIGLVDIDGGFSPFSYSIPSNNKSFSIFFAYYSLFSHASFYGGQIADFLYSKVGQSKFSRFIKHFYYFLKFRDFTSSQIRVHFSKLRQVNSKIKGFRFLFKDSGHNRLRLKFQRLYLDLFVKASLPQLKSPFKKGYNNNKRSTRIVHFNRFGIKNRFDPFYKDFNKFKKDYSRNNNKFKKNYSRNNNRDNAFVVQKGHKRKFNFRKKKKFNIFLI